MLLDLQDELQELEDALEEHIENEDDESRRISRRYDRDQDIPESRKDLMREIQSKLEEYGVLAENRQYCANLPRRLILTQTKYYSEHSASRP